MSTPLLVDAPSLFSFQQLLKERDFPVQGNINYAPLLDALAAEVPGANFDPKLAFVAVNPENDGQDRFVSYLRRQQGFTVDVTDYRDAYIVPDRSSQYQRLTSRLSYTLGMFAQRKPSVLVVSDAFDLYYPLLDFVQVRGGKAIVSFFRSAMEARWQRVGLYGDNSPIKFVDLDPHAKAIIGVELTSGGCTLTSERGGLGSLKF